MPKSSVILTLNILHKNLNYIVISSALVGSFAAAFPLNCRRTFSSAATSASVTLKSPANNHGAPGDLPDAFFDENALCSEAILYNNPSRIVPSCSYEKEAQHRFTRLLCF
ncbi:hypothetical protein DJ90_6520 [Paenibacillus macerans]|uniref:Uncharacterized protein n=1 Tax=Paenibacillus macerans TaxID=44252 RepID=A0A090ZJ11_PAEMA|nr:hypothetical protein DJ90_6520 [Paenibacillus macerans]